MSPRGGAPSAVLREGWFEARQVAPLGDGYINDTLLVEAARGRFVLQRINERVFPDPWSIVEKVSRVVAHVEARAPGRVPALEPARDGRYGWRDERGSVWRLWRYVGNTRTLQSLENLAQIRAAARGFGELQVLLQDLDGELPDPIPGFMQLAHYLGAFEAALENSSTVGPEVRRWVPFILARRGLAEMFQDRDRVIHADCKVNNLLFHIGFDSVASVLDLDTVMLGHWAWDFGDLARSAAADASGFSADRFLALAEAFVPAAGIEPDWEALLMAPRYVALMLGLRFLTDHVRGDLYFKVDAPGDNLNRALSQFTLLRAMEQQEVALRARLKRI